MKILIRGILTLLFVLLAGCGKSDSDENRDDRKDDPFAIFSKQVEVYGVKIYATEATGDDKVRHAAAVMAEYLDNDEDGAPDNRKVVDALMRNNAILIMFENEEEQEKLFRFDRQLFEEYALQNLFDRETLPGGAERGVFDATLEEVLHLITFGGYAHAYPEIFGEKKGTAVSKAVDLARGGYFESVPKKYPEDAWYTYYDETCDYPCQITEYMYWAITSILGAQDFPGRFEQIDDEWRLNTREKVRRTDPAIYNLITDPQYKFATVLPDGDYKGGEIAIQKIGMTEK